MLHGTTQIERKRAPLKSLNAANGQKPARECLHLKAFCAKHFQQNVLLSVRLFQTTLFSHSL